MIALAEIFSETLRRIDTCIPHVPYNFVLHTNPCVRDRWITIIGILKLFRS